MTASTAWGSFASPAVEADEEEHDDARQEPTARADDRRVPNAPP